MGFFTNTRKGGWIQEVAGENESWIHVKGMKEWHVWSALRYLQYVYGVAGIPIIEGAKAD